MLKQDFIAALKLTSSFYDNFHQVVFQASVPKKTLEIKTKNNDVGEGAETIKATVAGQDLTIAFNHKYIFDCLGSIDSESITLEFSGQNKPLIISTPNNRTFTYLVMPMNR